MKINLSHFAHDSTFCNTSIMIISSPSLTQEFQHITNYAFNEAILRILNKLFYKFINISRRIHCYIIRIRKIHVVLGQLKLSFIIYITLHALVLFSKNNRCQKKCNIKVQWLISSRPDVLSDCDPLTIRACLLLEIVSVHKSGTIPDLSTTFSWRRVHYLT